MPTNQTGYGIDWSEINIERLHEAFQLFLNSNDKPKIRQTAHDIMEHVWNLVNYVGEKNSITTNCMYCGESMIIVEGVEFVECVKCGSVNTTDDVRR